MPCEQEAEIDEYTKVIEEEPDSVSVYLLRADCYRKMGKYVKAVADYTKAIELEPGKGGGYRWRQQQQ